RVFQVVGPYGVRIQVDAPQVDDPDQLRGVVHDNLRCRAAGRVTQFDRLDPVRARVGGALLKEWFTLGAVDEALERHRAAVDAAKSAIGDSQVVVHQVQLGVPRLREIHLVWIADRHLAALDLQDEVALRHATAYASRDDWYRGGWKKKR